MKNSVRIAFLLFILFGAAHQGYAVSFDHDLKEIEKKYGQHNAVYLYKKEQLVIDIDKDSLRMKNHVKQAILLLNENSKVGSFGYIHYSSFVTVDNIKAYTYIPVKGKYKKVKTTDFKTTHSLGGSVFYDDFKQIEIVFPQVSKGAVMILEYDELVKDPYFLNGMNFQTGIPVLEANLSVKVNENVSLLYRFFNRPSKNVFEKSYKKGKYNFYEWTLKDLDEGRYGVSYYGYSHLATHIKLFIGDVKIEDKTLTYYTNSVDGLYKLYHSFIEKIDTTYSDDFIQKVKEITKDCDSDREKAKNILYWVQKNIKYVAYEQGLRGFIPHSSESVFSKRYGDCKDMSSLIVGMMRCAGLECYYSWVGTRQLAYSYDELPTISTDNHMVACYKDGAEYIIMDGTMDLYEFGLVPHHIQGKQVLVSMDEQTYKILNMPLTNKEVSSMIDTVNLVVEGESLIGKAIKTFKGYNRYEIATALNGRKNGKLEKKLNATLARGSNKFALDTFQIGNVTDRDHPFVISYGFTLDDYLQTIGDEMYINLNLDMPLAGAKIDTSEYARPLENDFYFTETYVTELKIPEGYQVSFIPENSQFKGTDLSFSITYEKTDNSVIQNKTLDYSFLVVNPENFKTWDDMIITLNKAYRQTIVLEDTKL